MKGKAATLVISCLVFSGCQAQVKQSVFAENKETLASQQVLFSTESSTSSSSTPPAASQPVETIESSAAEAPAAEAPASIEESVTETAKEEAVADSQEQTVDTSATEATSTSPASSEESKETTNSKQATSESKATEEPSLKEVQQVIQPPVTAEKVEENYQFSVVKNQTTEEFIQAIGKDAQQIAWTEGLYASVMIAQAILETGSGNSQLARPPHHNLFGIKGSYQGKQVSFNTQEDKGNGQLYTIQAAFRQYPSYKESLEDYAALLKNGLSGNPGFYQTTWKEHAPTYQSATKALTGKYATDTAYDKKLNALIETYQLSTYDQEPKQEERTEAQATRDVLSSRENTTGSEQKTSVKETKESQPPVSRETLTEYPVMQLPPVAQRPAKQLSGNRTAQ